MGSVTTLVTLPALPASWAAMLPQKFSPATMFKVLAGGLPPANPALFAVVGFELEQLASTAAVTTASAPARKSRERPLPGLRGERPESTVG